jgi:VIT1/CCC1 family predicted Fe2+/Mn2+ transporter
MPHLEQHKSHRIAWLRAAVLGANDGIVSTASLIIGVAAADSSKAGILLAGVAGLVAGAMSMAAGEYVSVSSQADTEAADLAIEQRSLLDNSAEEALELAQIYQQRGLSADLAQQVADQLMAVDALAAHARDELGLTESGKARPLQAAWSSALTFLIGAALPLLTALWAPTDRIIGSVALSSLLCLIGLGALSARAGGASMAKGALRVGFWGALAMLVTAQIGQFFGVAA